LKQVCLLFVKSSFPSLGNPEKGIAFHFSIKHMTNATLLDQIRSVIPATIQLDEQASPQHTSAQIARWIAETSEEKASNALHIVLSVANETRAEGSNIASATLVGIIRRLNANQSLELSQKILTEFQKVYPESVALPGFQSLALRTLIAANTPAGLTLFADLLVSNPAPNARLCVEIFGDLLKLDGTHTEALFPKLLDGLNNPELAAFILDYANYVFRRGMISPHPAMEKASELISLLSTLAERLGKLQDSKPESDEEATSLGKQVTEAVSLGIPLCDALACIGDVNAIGSLNKTLQVEHRRLRVEAAAALSKLGVEDARQLLAAMAAEPVERLRVLAYAEELDMIDDVDEEFSNIVARAEAEFVTYLAQPAQFGIPPQHVELVDQREQAWPGYEEPRNCYLFQFVYQFEMGEFTNIGIAGPLVRAVQPSLTGFSYDDVYAIFAGWHVDHPDILAIEAERTVGVDQVYLQRMLDSLTSSEKYQEVHPVLLGKLLDQNALVASAQRNEETGWVIVNEDSISWIPLGSPHAPLSAEDTFHLFVGRSLLRSFN